MKKQVLVLPIGSAEAERGFSIMNHIRTKRRASLHGTTIQSLMRIRMNGPELPEFNAFKYAKAWIDAGNMRTDDTTWVKKDSKKRKLDDYEDEIETQETLIVMHTNELTKSTLF